MAKKRDNKERIQTFIGRDDVSVVANIQENCILTTEDKIKILYNEYNEARKYSGEFWTFLGLFLSLLISILTCEFKSIFGISESVIEAVFILATFVALIFSICALVNWIRNRKKLTFEYFINQIRGDNSDT